MQDVTVPTAPLSSPKTPHPVVRDALRVLTQEGDRSSSPAKLRLAMQIGYNIYSIGHWEAGRRQPCDDAVARMEAIVRGGR
jgi:hypothetical protein